MRKNNPEQSQMDLNVRLGLTRTYYTIKYKRYLIKYIANLYSMSHWTQLISSWNTIVQI